jgi:hypothetical protein
MTHTAAVFTLRARAMFVEAVTVDGAAVPRFRNLGPAGE